MLGQHLLKKQKKLLRLIHNQVMPNQQQLQEHQHFLPNQHQLLNHIMEVTINVADHLGQLMLSKLGYDLFVSLA
ncbi:unnamed protein product, partial [Musa hybrid cultivar]